MRILLSLVVISMLSACGIADYYGNQPMEEETIVENYRSYNEQNSYYRENYAKTSQNTYTIDKPYGVKDFSEDAVMPEVYTVVATRAINKMLDNTQKLYNDRKNNALFINDFEKDEDLPSGHYLAEYTSKKIINASRTFKVVNTREEANYLLKTLISRVTIEGSDNKIIQYKLILSDKDENVIDEWIETIRRTESYDNSWW